MFTQLRYLSFMVTSIFLLFILYSCSENLQSRIIVKWIEKDGKESIEFLKDGTVIGIYPSKFKSGSESVTGNYKFIENNRLKIDFGIIVGTVVAEVSIDKEGRLNLKEPNGKVEIFMSEAMAKKMKN